MNLSELALKINAKIVNEESLTIHSINTLEDAKPGDITFILDKKNIQKALDSKASAFITFKDIEKLKKPQLIVEKPRETLAAVILLFYPDLSEPNITDAISSSTSIEKTASIGPFTVIKDHTSIGHHTIIHNNISIGKNCKIGDHCIIHPNVTLYDNCHIGNNVIIHAGSTIGSDGFGYYQKEGRSYKIKHIGSVIIEDNVEIGANASIDRGCLGKTIIGSGSKIDNLVQIAHNTHIQSNCLIAAQVGFTGSCCVENNVSIGGQAGINSSNIGAYSIIAGKAGVTKTIKNKSFVSGFPAWDHYKELKKEAIVRKLIERKAP